MTEHLADRFNRHTVRQRYRCCEGVAGNVEGQSFLDAANRSYLFEVIVTLLITWYREQLAIRATTLVFSQNLQRILVRPTIVYRYLIYGAEALNHLHYIVVR